MNWDSQLDNLGIYYRLTPNATWHLQSAVYQNEAQAQGNHIILFTVLDDQGKPKPNVACVVDWVGRDPGDVPTRMTTDAHGQANFPMFANLDVTKKNGPYFAYIDSPSTSDQVAGMGLPEHHHVNYLLTFGLQVVPPPSLDQVALAAAKSVPWMPVNNQAALWQYAKAHNLQDQQTDEIPFTYNGEQYIAQVFNLGIVYVKVGDWANVKVIPK